MLEPVASEVLTTEETTGPEVKNLETLLSRLNAIHGLLSNPTSKVKCGPDCFIYSEKKDLVYISEFFSSMIKLNSSEITVIDATLFCSNQETLTSLIHYANMRRVVKLDFSVETIANMIFLVDPLQLNGCIQFDI